MKTKILFTISICAVFAFVTVTTAKAQDVGATVNVSASASVTPPPGPTNQPPLTPGRPTLKATMENRIEANGEARNNLLEQRKEVRAEATSTIKVLRTDTRAQLQLIRASSTDMFKRAPGIRQEIKTKMEAQVYAVRKDALIKELTISTTNITTISARIDTRLTTAESQGKTVTDARTLFVTANAKLTQAKANVAAFQALNLNATSTTEVDLTRPRIAGDAAIKSVKDARDAFQKVIVALAHDLGEKLPPPTPVTIGAGASVSNTTSGNSVNSSSAATN